MIGSITTALNVLTGSDLVRIAKEFELAKLDGYNQQLGPAFRRVENFSLNASVREEWMPLLRYGVWVDANFADILMPMLLRAQQAGVG